MKKRLPIKKCLIICQSNSLQCSKINIWSFFSHADGSVKFWDASAGTLQVLYKLKTNKVFEKPQNRSLDGVSDEDPFAIQLISFCPESRKLCVAGASSYVILFKFRKLESLSETCVSLIRTFRTGEVICGKVSVGPRGLQFPPSYRL